MNKLLKSSLILFSSLFIISCSSNSSSDDFDETVSESTELGKYEISDLKTLKSKYGALQITREDGKQVTYSYDSNNDTYFIKVEEEKAKYVIKGYTESHFIINNSDNLDTFKGVKLKLNNACIVSRDNYSPIHYSITSKNIEICAKNNTSNLIASLNGYNAISSDNNIEFSGQGALDIYTSKTKDDKSDGHCVKAAKKISIYDSIEMRLESAHDGLHGDSIVTISEDTNVAYKGKTTFINIVSQTMEATTNSCTGTIDLTGGTFVIDTADSIFKVDLRLIIGKGVSVVGTNIAKDPIVKQSQDEVSESTIIPELNVQVEGNFISNSITINSSKI